jgi:integrase
MKKFDIRPTTRRRMVTLEEIKALLSVAPEHRRLLYQVDFCSGLRANELRQLTPDHLEHDRKCLRLEAMWTKNRKAEFQPLPDWLFDELVKYSQTGEAEKLYSKHEAFRRGGKPLAVPDNPLLYVPRHTSRPLNGDLQEAGIEKLTGEGVIDFHAIRTGYINLVIRTGCDLKTAQSLARHSTPELTMNTYGRADEKRLREAVEKVGEMIGGLQNPDERGFDKIELHTQEPDSAFQKAVSNPIISPEYKKAEQANACPALTYLVGERGFEPPASGL